MKNKSFKNFITKFKNVWQVPRYRALIKLGCYLLFFCIVFSLPSVSYNSQNNNSNTSPAGKEEKDLSYKEIIENSNKDVFDIKYNLVNNDFTTTLTGQIKNNILTGFLEGNESILKITVKDNTIYNIINNEETYDEVLNNQYLSYFLIPQNIFNLVNNQKAYIEKNEEESSYTYNINYNDVQYEIILKTDLKYVKHIIINNNTIKYDLELLIDK